MNRYKIRLMPLGLIVLGISSMLVVAGMGSTQTIITGASVFDVHRGVFEPQRAVVMEGERIVDVRASRQPGFMKRALRGLLGRSSADAPAGARVIDATGKYIIPGLIDAHCHLVFLLDAVHLSGDRLLPFYLAFGVTGLRDTGDGILAEKLLSRYAEARPDLAPRVFLCSPLIDSDPPFHKGPVSRSVTSPDQVPAVVDEMAAWGAITLKLYVGTKREVGRKVIEEGHRHGLMVTAHLGNYSPWDACEDGIDCFEHIWAISEFAPRCTKNASGAWEVTDPKTVGLINLLREHHVMLDPTLVVFRNMIYQPDLPEVRDNPENQLVPEALRKTYVCGADPKTAPERRDTIEQYEALTGALYRAGVTLLAGTDTPEPYVIPGIALHQELELLVRSGLPPAAALQAATINNARAVKQTANLGSIEKGKLADLVILDADPLVDIRNTRRIFRVVRGGIVLDPEAILKSARAAAP